MRRVSQVNNVRIGVCVCVLVGANIFVGICTAAWVRERSDLVRQVVSVTSILGELQMVSLEAGRFSGVTMRESFLKGLGWACAMHEALADGTLDDGSVRIDCHSGSDKHG